MKKMLYFTASWCNPCQRTKPFAEELIAEGFNITFVDADENIDLVKKFEIKSIPTYILIDNELEVDRMNGAKTKDQLINFMNG